MRSTYSLDIVTKTICNDDNQVDIIRGALENALALYQWEYQKSTNRAKRDMTKELTDALKVVKSNLEFLGQRTLIEELEEVFTESDAGLRDSNILTLVNRHMKQYLFNCGMTPSIHKNKFAKYMERIFMEWCEAYPLDEAPASFDSDFEPPIY